MISNCEVVVRFNDMKNKKLGERVDVLALRQHPNGWFGDRACGKTPSILLENPSWTNSQKRPPACNAVERLSHPYAIFPRCADVRTSTAKYGASSGTMLIDALERNPLVNRVDVYGMNWNMRGHDHVENEGQIIRKCARKIHIHETCKGDYLP
jgi:hypothetical protein